MNLRIGNNNTSTSRILNGTLGLSLFSANTTDAATHMISLKGFNVLDLKSLKEEIIQSQNSHGILQVEAEHKSLQEISSLLDSADVLGKFGCSHLNSATLGVHSDLQFHVFNESLKNGLPVLLKRCVSVTGHRDSSVLVLYAQVSDLDLIEFDLVCSTLVVFSLNSLKSHELFLFSIFKLHVLIDTSKCSLSSG